VKDLLKTIWRELNRQRPLRWQGLHKALVPIGELVLGLAAIGTWATGVTSIPVGVMGIAGLSALGVWRATERRSLRVAGKGPGGLWWLKGSPRVQACRDLAAAGVFSVLPFLILPTAGYLVAAGEMGLGLASLLAGCSAFLPTALFAKEGLLRLAQGGRGLEIPGGDPTIPTFPTAGDSLFSLPDGGNS